MFHKIEKEVGKRKETMIMNNNTSKSAPVDCGKVGNTIASVQNIEKVTEKIIKNHIKAFEKLAKD